MREVDVGLACDLNKVAFPVFFVGKGMDEMNFKGGIGNVNDFSCKVVDEIGGCETFVRCFTLFIEFTEKKKSVMLKPTLVD